MGDFRLAKELFGATISSIRDNLRNRVIPNLERGNEKKLEKAENVIYQFAQYLLSPTAENLQHVDESMSKNLDFCETAELGFFERCSSFFATHAILKHVTIVGLVLSASVIPAFLGFYYGPISIDTALITFSAIFGPLIAVYLSYVLKRQ